MNDIEIIRYSNDKVYFRIKRGYFNNLIKNVRKKKLSSVLLKLLEDSKGEYIDVAFKDFQELLNTIFSSTEFYVNSDFIKVESGSYLDNFMKILNEYFKIREKIAKNSELDSKLLVSNYLNNAVEKNALTELQQDLTSIISLLEVVEFIYKRRDLVNAKEDILESLKYIVPLEELENYKQEYERLINEVPIDLDKIEKYLKELQIIILNDWQKKVTSLVDYKPGEKYTFIGHSTNVNVFEGDFHSPFVSCSLHTEEFTDTFHSKSGFNSGFGFILAPINIVGASGQDMYVDNNAANEDNMFNYTIVPKIDSLERVIEICRLAREHNKQKGLKSKVYGEVVIKGFNPIGLFCFTLGEKSLSTNYKAVQELQKQFPNLEIQVIDLTLYKTKEELSSYRDFLIHELEIVVDPKNCDIKTKKYYDLFNYFWDKYFELIKTGDYDENDIIDLYRENSELISIGMSPQQLFSGNYGVEAIRYCIMNNFSYNLQSVLSGRVDASSLKKLGQFLIAYADNELLKTAVPGLSELIKIVNVLNVEDIDVELICKNHPITIESITNILQISLNSKNSKLKDEIVDLGKRKTILLESYENKEEELEQQYRYGVLIDFEYYFSIAQSDYEFINEELIKIQAEKEVFESEYNEHLIQHNNLLQEQRNLSVHRFLNYFKLKRLTKLLKTLDIKAEKLRRVIKLKNAELSDLLSELYNVKLEFKEKVGIDLLEFEEELKLARELYNTELIIHGRNRLETIKTEIEELDKKISLLTVQQSSIEEVITNKNM